MKQFLFIFAILMIASVSATTIFSGDSSVIELEKQYSYWSVVGNASEVDIEVTQDANNNVTITAGKYAQGDTFEIVFFDVENEVIVIYKNGGGGGSTTITEEVEVEVQVPHYITKYEDVEVDKEVEVVKEVEVDKIIKSKMDFALLIVAILLLIVFISYMFSSNAKLRKAEDEIDTLKMKGGLNNE